MKRPIMTVDYIEKKSERQFTIPVEALMRPKSKKDYQFCQCTLDKLTDIVRDDEKHPLATIMQIIGENLEEYDDRHHPSIYAGINSIDVVKQLMAEHQLLQKDLAAIFGGQANVSKFLNGKRPLTKQQIAGLKKRFSISADLLI